MFLEPPFTNDAMGVSHRRFLIESARKLLLHAQDIPGDENDDWAVRNALLSLQLLKPLTLGKQDVKEQPKEHRHD